MRKNEYEQYICQTFDSYCKKILKNEARDILREYERQRSKEVFILDLVFNEYSSLCSIDDFSVDHDYFIIGDNEIVIKNDKIANALRMLPDRSRDIILMAYFLDMCDSEIAESMSMIRSTVQYQRTKSLKKIREFLENEKET